MISLWQIFLVFAKIGAFTIGGGIPMIAAIKSELVDAPIIRELPMTLECRVISYDKESCQLIGEIVNVSAEESYLNDKGEVDTMKLRPLLYDPMSHCYRVPGEIAARAFHVGMSLK